MKKLNPDETEFVSSRPLSEEAWQQLRKAELDRIAAEFTLPFLWNHGKDSYLPTEQQQAAKSFGKLFIGTLRRTIRKQHWYWRIYYHLIDLIHNTRRI